MYRVDLTAAQRAELEARCRQWGLAPRTRARLEMLRLADAGWSVPKIARLLNWHEQTVRKYIKAFLTASFDLLADRPRSGRPPKLTEADLTALEQLLDESAVSGRTWTLPQLVQWLEGERGVKLSAGRLSCVLHRRRFRWKRTQDSLRHRRPDRALFAQAHAELRALMH